MNDRSQSKSPPSAGNAAGSGGRGLTGQRPSLIPRRAPLTVLGSRLINALRLADLPEHRRRVKASRRVLSTLSRFDGEGVEGRTFAYLRAIDPLAFEEVVLSAIEAAGYIVLRNRAYTGDGGIDGRVVVPGTLGRTWAVQAKRYSSAVTPDHVRDFVRAIRAAGHDGGIFVHCGRTGPMTYRWLAGTPVELISGSTLLGMLRR